MTDQDKYAQVKKSKEIMLQSITDIEVVAIDLAQNLAATQVVLHSIKGKKKKHDNKNLASQGK